MDRRASSYSQSGESRRSSVDASLETMNTTKKKRKQSSREDTISSPPTRRVAKACDLCRLAKVRCGGEKPLCTRCVETQLPCSYDSPLRRRGPEKGINYKINQRMSNLERLLATTLDEVRRKPFHADDQPPGRTDEAATLCVDERPDQETVSRSGLARSNYKSAAPEDTSSKSVDADQDRSGWKLSRFRKTRITFYRQVSRIQLYFPRRWYETVFPGYCHHCFC